MAGVYIHIPFCKSKCAYCDFYSHGRYNTDLQTSFMHALANEWLQRQHEITEPIRTVYIGGGTPSCLSTTHLDEICSFFREHNSIDEFTIEVNPEDIDDRLLRFIEDSPVNRVSMGVQSLVDDELRFIGRRHDAAKAERAVEALRQAGIKNISCDLIFGLPLQTFESWKYSLDRMTDSINPEHLSAYLLSYEHGTRLYAMRSKGALQEAGEDLIHDMYDYLCTASAKAGYEHYEISNYARPVFRSRHNSSYWTYTPYLGLGPGAHSFDGIDRAANIPDQKLYIESRGLIAETEHLTPDERTNERIMIGLRTLEGLDISTFDKYDEIKKSAMPYIANGQLILKDDRFLSVAENAWMLTDSILVDLFV